MSAEGVDVLGPCLGVGVRTVMILLSDRGVGRRLRLMNLAILGARWIVFYDLLARLT